MAEKKQERISIFIDGSNLYYSLKDLGVAKIDFQKLVDLLKKGRLLVSVFYYNAPLDISVDAKKYWEQQKFFDALRRIPGFNVILARMRKHKRENGTFVFEVKGDDIYFATDLVSGAYEDLYDTALIVSGDEDFVPAIRKVQKLGKKVENIYFWSTSSNYLKKTCNTSFCIDKKIAKSIELK
ncbi:NYN domain-containing protein [Candidatus Pacearchaeota archaeon]|nr:NYN domain-containing protein [Candidatus Pacearchaeota archaeon]